MSDPDDLAEPAAERAHPCDLCGAPAVGELSMDVGPKDVLVTRYCSEHVDRMLPAEEAQ